MTNANVVREVALGELAPVRVYLDVISSSQDPNEVSAARDLYSSLFDIDPPHTKSWEDYTQRVSDCLSEAIGVEPRTNPVQKAIYQLEDILDGGKAKSYSPEERLLHARINAVTHLVRSMIQGNQDFPVERFGEVIDMCTEALVSLDASITPRKAKRLIRLEVSEIWEVRSAEALKLVGAPTRHTAYKIGSKLVKRVANIRRPQ